MAAMRFKKERRVLNDSDISSIQLSKDTDPAVFQEKFSELLTRTSKKMMKGTLPAVLLAAVTLAPVQVQAASTDIDGHWAKGVITDWQNKGLIRGYADGTFHPDGSITRAEFVTIMNNVMGFSKAGNVSFKDVMPTNWFHNAVAVAVAQGYCSGYEDGTFRPDMTISREEAATMLARVKGLAPDESGAAGFHDMISSWARGSVGAVAKAGYMNGYPDGTFGAAKSITRAEAVASINKALNTAPQADKPAPAPEEKKDIHIKEAKTTIADQTVTGNLIIDESVGDGEATVKNTTVKGDIIVKGGGTHSVYLDSVKVEGKIIVDKKDVKVQLDGKTSVSNISVQSVCTLTTQNLSNTVGSVSIDKELGTSQAVVINLPVKDIHVEATASVDLQKDVENVYVSKKADGTKTSVASGINVNKMVADSKMSLFGLGKIDKLEVNADDVRISSNVKVKNTDVAKGIKKPSVESSSSRSSSSSSSRGGGGGSSSRPKPTPPAPKPEPPKPTPKPQPDTKPAPKPQPDTKPAPKPQPETKPTPQPPVKPEQPTPQPPAPTPTPPVEPKPQPQPEPAPPKPAPEEPPVEPQPAPQLPKPEPHPEPELPTPPAEPEQTPPAPKEKTVTFVSATPNPATVGIDNEITVRVKAENLDAGDKLELMLAFEQEGELYHDFRRIKATKKDNQDNQEMEAKIPLNGNNITEDQTYILAYALNNEKEIKVKGSSTIVIHPTPISFNTNIKENENQITLKIESDGANLKSFADDVKFDALGFNAENTGLAKEGKVTVSNDKKMLTIDFDKGATKPGKVSFRLSSEVFKDTKMPKTDKVIGTSKEVQRDVVVPLPEIKQDKTRAFKVTLTKGEFNKHLLGVSFTFTGHDKTGWKKNPIPILQLQKNQLLIVGIPQDGNNKSKADLVAGAVTLTIEAKCFDPDKGIVRANDIKVAPIDNDDDLAALAD